MLTRPPLGHPRFSARAVATAACAAAQRPRAQRRPLVHALVLFSSDAPRLFDYARDVLDLFAAHGIDIYLQTDVREVGAPARFAAHDQYADGAKLSDAHAAPRPITVDNVEEIVAASPVDFFMLVTEQNISRRTVQVRVGTQFVEREIEKHAMLILDAWATAISRELGRQHKFNLGINPNVVTNKHIDFLLQQHPRLRDIRPAYAMLARLVDFTCTCLDDDHRHVLASISAPTTEKGAASPATESSTVGSLESTDNAHLPNSINLAAAPEASQTTGSPALSKEEMDSLSKSALAHGLKHVLARTAAERECDLEVLERATPTVHWLKRSSHQCARLLRGQFLVRSIHSRLVDTFPVISSAPIAHTADYSKAYSVPSEAHRQRLLREVNFLVSRMEELGSRLSRRPKTRRRRRLSSTCNPWSSYINNARGAPRAHPGDAPRGNGYYGSHEDNGWWTCLGCHSQNRPSAPCCTSCRAPSCVLERGLLPEASEHMANRVREAIKKASLQRRPWIFAPSPVSVSPSSTSSAGSMHVGLGGRRAETTQFAINHVAGSTTDPIGIPQGHAPNSFHTSGRQLSPDLMDGFRGISVDEAVGNEMNVHRLYESTPARSPESGLGLVGGLSSHFPTSNGADICEATAIPISRTRNLDASPPSRSPGGAEYRGRVSEQVRAASLDAGVLGGGVSRSSTQWFGHDVVGRATEVGHVDTLLGRSPPMFGSVNGYDGASGSFFDASATGKGGMRGDTRVSGNGGRHAMAPRSYEHFSSGMFAARSARTVSHMDELAVGSVEARNLSSSSRYMGRGGVAALGARAQRSSLEDLAAASDAANGGLGSATTESIRAVMALRSDFDRSRNGRENGGGYGLF